MSQPLTDPATVWDWLRVDLVDSGASPTEPAPVDADLISGLILAAEIRLETFIGAPLAELIAVRGSVPEPLTRAICIDVATFYFSRTNPELPDGYWEAIAPWRAWSFGA